MNTYHKNIISKILILGALVALLVYLFHPSVGQLNLTFNGEPVTEPVARLAALPTVLLVLIFTVVLSGLLFLGLGLILFPVALVLAFVGIVVVAPYVWPVLALILLIVVLMSLGHRQER